MPRAFRFALQALLDRRIYDEQRMELLASQAAQTHAAMAREVERLATAIQVCLNELCRHNVALSTWERQLFERHRASLECDIENAAQRATGQLAAVEQASRQLQDARRARAVVERLRDQARRIFDENEARLEELEIDDANARLHERVRGRHTVVR